MKRLIFYAALSSLFILSFNVSLKAQELKNIRIDQYGKIIECEILYQKGETSLKITVDGQGSIKGIAYTKENQNKVTYDYYDEFAEPERQSKPYLLGDMEVSYFTTLEAAEKEGKLSKIGDLAFDYFISDPDKAGRIYHIGALKFDYYTRYTDNSLKGKLSLIGDLNFEYFSEFNEREKSGKIRKIGEYEMDYYTLYDNDKKAGRIKELKGKSNNFSLQAFVTP